MSDVIELRATRGGKKAGARETKYLKEALLTARRVMAADHPIGEIVGSPGTGKSTAAKVIAEQMGGARIACFSGMTRHQLLRDCARALGLEGHGAVDRMLSDRREAEADTRRLLIVDEANKLNWRGLEALRYLSDECNVAVLLVGTELYERQFVSPKSRDYLVQLGSRIGAKRCRMGMLDRAETYTHVMRPILGDVADKEVVTRFWIGARKGVWRDALELAQECRAIMDAQGVTALTMAVLDAALAWSANRHAVEAA
ncbi:MAG: ATP-binding protein [Rhodocyclaceae bacterium]|nr:ATP-binding protein [Rhodocyclaceae bacterium]